MTSHISSFYIFAYALLGVILAYLLYSLVFTFLPKTRKSIREYKSRFIFRLVFFIRYLAILTFLITSHRFDKSWIFYVCIHASYIIADLGIMCLMRSIQDFARFVNREQSFITKYFYNLIIPTFLVLTIHQIALIYTKYWEEEPPYLTFSISYDVFFGIVVILMVYFPILVYFIEIDKNDMAGEKHKHAVFGYIYIALNVLILLTMCAVHFYILKDSIAHEWKLFYREPMYLLLSFTQTFLDWIITSMLGDSETDNLRADPLNINLVS